MSSTKRDTRNMLGLRVLLCIADEEEATVLARALRSHGLDALVAHSIAGAVRVIQRESPQALVVEIGLTSFDGFRVANAAIGQVHATFLVSERRLTLMEDVEVLRVGARETFYKPLKAETIAASIKGACGPETRDGAVESGPATRHVESPPSFAKTVARPFENKDAFDIPKTLMQPRAPNHVQDTLDSYPIVEADNPDTLPAEPFTVESPREISDDIRPDESPVNSTPESLRATPPITTQTARSTELVDELFEQSVVPSPTGESSLSPDSSAVGNPSRPRGGRRKRKLIATGEDPTVDPTSIAELDDALVANSRSIARSKPQEEEASPPEEDATESAKVDGQEDIDGQQDDSNDAETADDEVMIDPLDSRARSIAVDEGPKTSEFMAAALAPSAAALFVHKALIAAIILVSAYIGWRVVDVLVLSAPDVELTEAESSEPVEELSQEEEAEKERLFQINSLMSEAIIAFRDADYETSAKSFQAALKLEPEQKTAMLGMAAVALKTENVSGAQNWLDNLAALYPAESQHHLRAALLRYASDDRAGTIEGLRQFLKIAADEDPSLRAAAQLHRYLTAPTAAP